MTLEQLFAGRDIDIAQVKAKLKTVADELGLPYGDRSKTFNSRLAQELAKWAEEQGAGHAFHHAAFKAYFVDGLNFAQTSVLGDIAEKVGLDRKEAEIVITERRFKDAVDADWQRARKFNIRAVPTFVLGDQTLIGAQQYEALARMLKAGGVAKRAA